MIRITIHVPHDVTFDLEKMMKITKTVLGKLGCDGCHSGRVLEFVATPEFVVNATGLDQSPSARLHPWRWRGGRRESRVSRLGRTRQA